MKKYYFPDLAIRYLLIIIFGFGNLYLIYSIFTPATINSVYFILNLISPASQINSTIIFNSLAIELIPACIAGSAYYLLLILNLSTPDIKISKRIIILLLSFVSLFILNILRIITLALINNTLFFDFTHVFFWYFVSTLFVALIWIFFVKLFNIKSIPVYSDFKNLLKND